MIDVLLTPEEIKKVETDFCNLDSCNALYLDRGHWEYIAPYISIAAQCKLLGVLHQPCREHRSKETTMPVARILCPKCMAEIERLLK